MAQYLALYFDQSPSDGPLLNRWLAKEGQEINKGDPLFTYGDEDQSKEFSSRASGKFKVYLWKEGEALQTNCEVAVLQVAEEEAQAIMAGGWGKIITPDEAKTGMSYAEAASIRLPPS